MPTYEVQDNRTGKIITFEWNGDDQPTDADFTQIFAAANSAPKNKPFSKKDIATAALNAVGSAVNMPVASATRQAIKFGRRAYADPRGTLLDLADQLPAAGSVVAPLAVTLPTGGTAIPAAAVASGLGAAGGEGLRQMARRALGAEVAPKVDVPLPFVNKQIPRIPGVSEPVSNMIEQGALGVAADLGGSVVGKVADAARTGAVASARRSLGYMKSNLTSTKSFSDAMRKQIIANKAAETLLDKGAISKLGSTSETANNILKLKSQAQASINSIIDATDKSASISTQGLGNRLLTEINPKYQDEYDALVKIAGDLESNGPAITLRALKNEIKPNVGLAWNQAPSARSVVVTRRASKIIENVIKETIEKTSGKEALAAYNSANSLYGKSKNALNAIAPQMAAEMGNALPSVRGTVAAAAQIAAGNPLGAVGSLGVTEGLLRRGAGISANALNAVSKMKSSGPLAKALLMRRKKSDE